MALKAKVRGNWRIVSKSMARWCRAKGIEVVDTEARVVAFRKAPGEIVHVTPPTPPAETVVTLPGVSNAKLAERIAAKEAEATSRPLSPVDDLTDDELERLTAPES